MNGLVNVEVVNGKPCVTSLQVADAFEKEHKNVLADIRNTLSKCSESFNGLNFQLVEYTDTKGEKRPMYLLTKDGFMMLAMGYTTPEAMRVKEAYIARFNEMEEELRHPRYQSNSLIDAHVRAAVAILSCAGLEGNQLALAADKFYTSQTGVSVFKSTGIDLKEPKQDVHCNATQLGAMMGGVKARAVNKRLAAAGLQEFTPAGWRPTEFGRQYSVLLDTGKKMGNGTPVTQLKWYPTVLDVIA